MPIIYVFLEIQGDIFQGFMSDKPSETQRYSVSQDKEKHYIFFEKLGQSICHFCLNM